MKKSFSTGLIILLPLALTLWLMKYLFDLFTDPLFHLLENLLLTYEQQQGHETLIRFLSRIVALVLTFFFIVLLGFFARKLFLETFLKLFGRLTLHIPLIGTLYRLSKDITKAVLSSDNKAFKETVLTPFPSPETYSVGFVTGEVPAHLRPFMPNTDVAVFIPTAPHPISGYVLFCSRKELQTVDISIEETFKFLISCGVVSPAAGKPS
jgi:uncharacterized membrane protein